MKLGEAHGLAARAGEGEIGGAVADGDGHGLSTSLDAAAARGFRASRVAALELVPRISLKTTPSLDDVSPSPTPALSSKSSMASEVHDLEDLLLLVLPGREVESGPERRVVLEAERDGADGARGLEGRLERRALRGVGAGERLVEDGVQDEEPVLVGHATMGRTSLPHLSWS